MSPDEVEGLDAIIQKAKRKLQTPVEQSMLLRYTDTHLHCQDTDAVSCRVKSRREETPSIERRATLSDKNGKTNKSVQVPKVSSS